jgi:hypothetical protein
MSCNIILDEDRPKPKRNVSLGCDLISEFRPQMRDVSQR